MKDGYYLSCPECEWPLEMTDDKDHKKWTEYLFTCPSCKKQFVRKVEYQPLSLKVVSDSLKPINK